MPGRGGAKEVFPLADFMKCPESVIHGLPADNDTDCERGREEMLSKGGAGHGFSSAES